MKAGPYSKELYTANQCKEHNVEKHIQWVAMLCRWQYGQYFIRLVVVASQIFEIPRNSPNIRIYSSATSSKVNDLGEYVTSY